MEKTLGGIAAVALAAIAAMAMLSTAGAHITANPGEGPAGGFFKADFRVPHGCEGAATTVVRIQIPDGVVSVTPQFKAGWEVETVVGELDEPVELHGETITEGVQEVIWRGGPLPSDLYDDFGISMRLPDRPGETIYFPTIQECEDGSEVAWITIPAEGEAEPEEPAPGIRLVESSGGHGGDDDAASADDDDGPDAVLIAALAVGVLGLVAGGGSLAYALRRR